MAVSGLLPWWTKDYKGNLISSGSSNDTVTNIVHPVSLKRLKPAILTLSVGTSLNRSREIITDSPCSVFQNGSRGNIYQTNVSQHCTLYPDSTGTSLDISIAPMLNQLRSGIRGQSVALGVCLAEYRKTATTVGNILGVVAAVVKTAVSKHPNLPHWTPGGSYATPLGHVTKLSKRQVHKLTNAHLEFVYGVLPLIGDINDAAATLAAIAKGRTVYVRARATRQVNFDVSVVKYSTNQNFYPMKGTKSTYAFKRVTLIGEAPMSVNPVYDTLFRAGLANPASIAWELIPFSFIVDWFVNVGDVIASLDNIGLTGGSITYVAITHTRISSSAAFGGGVGSYTFKGYYREAPVTTTSVATLEYKPSSSLTHITNGISLLLSAISKYKAPSRYG